MKLNIDKIDVTIDMCNLSIEEMSPEKLNEFKLNEEDKNLNELKEAVWDILAARAFPKKKFNTQEELEVELKKRVSLRKLTSSITPREILDYIHGNGIRADHEFIESLREADPLFSFLVYLTEKDVKNGQSDSEIIEEMTISDELLKKAQEVVRFVDRNLE